MSSGTTGKLRVSAVLAVRCSLVGAECRMGNTSVAPDARLSIPSRRGILTFEVAEPYLANPASAVDVRVSGYFVGLDSARAAKLRDAVTSDGGSTEFWGRTVFVGPAEPERSRSETVYRVSALLTLRSVIVGDEYRFAGSPLVPARRLLIPTRAGLLAFDVADRYPTDVGALAEVKVRGAFIGLDASRAASLSKSGPASPLVPELWGGVLSLGTAEPEIVRVHGRPDPVGTTGRSRVDAVLSLRCVVIGIEECRIGSTPIVPNARLSIPTRQGVLTFEVDELYPADVTPVEVRVGGVFVGLDATRAAALTATGGSDRTSEFWGRLRSVGATEPEVIHVTGGSGSVFNAAATGKFRVPAQITVRCVVVGNTCRLGLTNVEPNARLTIPMRRGILTFDVRTLYPYDPTTLRVTVRCATDRTILALIERDVAEGRLDPDDLQPRLVAVREIEEKISLRTGQGSYSWDQPGVAFSVIVDVPAQKSPTGWLFEGLPLKAGERFTYTRPGYTIGGVVTDVTPPAPTTPR